MRVFTAMLFAAHCLCLLVSRQVQYHILMCNKEKMCFASCQGAVKSCMTMHAQVNVHDPKLGIVQDSADKVIYTV